MRFLVKFAAVASLCAAGATAPALSQTQAAAPSAPPAGLADPNEVVCEKQEVTGSRLAARRVCRTRAEWAEARRLDRQEVEKVQTNRGLRGGN